MRFWVWTGLLSCSVQLVAQHAKLDLREVRGQLCLEVQYHDKVVVEASPVGLNVDHVLLGTECKVREEARTLMADNDGYRNFATTYAVERDDTLAYYIDVREFDDGVALRYRIPSAGPRCVYDEQTSFTFPVGTHVWYASGPFQYGWVQAYQDRAVGDIAIGLGENVRGNAGTGDGALADYAVKQQQAKTVGAMLCAKENETAEAVGHLKDECEDLRYALGEKEKMLVSCMAELVPDGEEAVCLFPDEMEGDSMRMLMNRVLERGHILCAVFCRCSEPKENGPKTAYRYVIGSRTLDMRSVVREFNPAFDGRGGGKPAMVQGTAHGSEAELRTWILKKAEEMSL